MNDKPAIHIDALRKTYRDKSSGRLALHKAQPLTRDKSSGRLARGGEEKEALGGVNLDIPRGSFFGLLGPNGAGKSTLINILAGLVVKTAGKVAICGHDIDRDVRQARLSIGVVPQELVIDTFFTVRQALEIQAGYYGIPKQQRRTQAIIDAMGLADKADINSRRLSGGMRRRLLIGKALVHDPPVLILDEPTAGVDVELREQLWDYVRGLNARGTTILLTTHYLEEAEELCDEIAIINHGTIIARDRKDNLMRGVDSKELVLTLNRPMHEVPEALAAYQASAQERSLCLKYAPSKVSFEQIIEAVRRAGYAIEDIRTREVELEDIFRDLTRSRNVVYP